MRGRQQRSSRRGTAADMATANRPGAPRRELARLAVHPDPLISRLVAQHDDLTYDLQRICAASTDEPTRRAIAFGERTETNILDWLSHDRCSSVRAAVAANPNTTNETLERLSHDNHWDVAAAVITNPAAEDAMLERLVAAAIRNGDPELIEAASRPWSPTIIDTVTLLTDQVDAAASADEDGKGSADMGPRDVLDVAIGVAG